MKLSANKTGKITIWRGDDPMELASSFARIYSLDMKARDLLVNVICQSMEQNGLLVLPATDYDDANPHDGHMDSQFPFPPESTNQSHRYHFSDNHHVAYVQGSAASAMAAGEEDDSFSGSSVSGSQDVGDGDGEEEGEGEGEDEEEEEDVEEDGQSDNSADRSLGSVSEEEES